MSREAEQPLPDMDERGPDVPGNPVRPPLSNVSRLALAAVATAALGACATAPDQVASGPNDPLEGFNRAVFGVNQAVDTVVVRPVAEVYSTVVPEPLQYNVRSFLRNLQSPMIIANNLLQGDMDGAGRAFERFFINTLVGVGGIADVAAEVRPDLKYESEDFGQTLAVWGVDSGPYVVLPLLGPSNARDAVGTAVDALADPVSWLLYAHDLQWVDYTRYAVTLVDARVQTLDTTDELEASSVDYYAAVRSLYDQYRRGQIDESGSSDIDIPDFETSGGSAPPADALPDMPDADAPVGPGPVSALPVDTADEAEVAAAPAAAFTMAPVAAIAVPLNQVAELPGAPRVAAPPVWIPTLNPITY
jgi:phospholipid-binding lipoprotein MlaA